VNLEESSKPQKSALGRCPTEILLELVDILEEDNGRLGGVPLILTCKKFAQTAFRNRLSKTPELLAHLDWQPAGYGVCLACQKSRPTEAHYWRDNIEHLHAWANLRNDTFGFSSEEQRYEDHAIDLAIYIRLWCNPRTEAEGDTMESQYCPPCTAQRECEMYTVDQALQFHPEFFPLQEAEMRLEMELGGHDFNNAATTGQTPGLPEGLDLVSVIEVLRDIGLGNT